MAKESYEQPVQAEDREEIMKYAAPGDLQSAIADALALIVSFGQIDGEHHKTWVIDQIVRKLVGEKYQAFIDYYQVGAIEGIDLSDPEVVAKAHQIGNGDYYSDDFTREEIDRVEDAYYSWDEGVAP